MTVDARLQETQSGCSSVNKDYEFNWLLFKRLGRLFRILFPSPYSPAVIPLVLFFSSAIVYEVLIFYAGLVPARFIKIIVEGNADGYMWEVFCAFVIIVLRALSKSTKRYMRCLLEVTWRKTLCEEIHNKYFHDINYYNINVMGNRIDNPDQRMSNDITVMVDSMGEVIADVLLRPMTIVYYSYEVYHTTGLTGITSSYVLIFFFMCINVKLLSPIVRTTAELDKKEGNYRFHQMHVRVYAESIAMHGSERVERKIANRKLSSVVGALHNMYWTRYLAFTAMDLFIFTKDVLSFAVFAIPYFGGEFSGLSSAELGEKIGQNTFVVGHLVHMFTDLIDNTTEISEMAGTTHRVAEFIEALDEMTEEAKTQNGHRGREHDVELDSHVDEKLKTDRNCLYNIKDLSVYPPGRCDVTKPIINNLQLRIDQTTHTLICGRGNCGKTSILRVLRGLWPLPSSESSKVWKSDFIKDNPNYTMYLPQKPLLTLGSLRSQLLYPDTEIRRGMCSDQQILRYIKKMGMEDLLDRTGGLDQEMDWNWYNVLSPSEAHRLSFVRLFYHKPKVVFLDDVLNTVDTTIIDFIYKEFRQLNMTVVTIGDKDMTKYHDKLLQLNTDGTWTFSEKSVRG